MNLPGAVIAVFGDALDRALALDADADTRLRALRGRVLAVEVAGLDIHVLLVPTDDRLALRQEIDRSADVRIRGYPSSLLALATAADSSALFGGGVRLEGDVTAARAYKRLFDQLRPDWEEAAARLLGDIPAHEAARLVGAARGRVARSGAGRAADLRAWLVDEVELVPAPGEVRGWMDAVDLLRADVDRLSARVRRLTDRAGAAGS